MKIEILYFEGCPTHEATVDRVSEVVARLGLDADIIEVDVETEEQARQLEFIGSPSVRVDGADIEPRAESNTTFGRRCRIYTTEEGLSGTPPASMLEAALRGEIYEAPASPETVAPAHDYGAPKHPPVRLLVADWCPQCPAAKSFWSELQKEANFDLEIVDIESEQGSELASAMGVRAVPATIVNEQVLFSKTTVPSRAQALEALGIDCC